MSHSYALTEINAFAEAYGFIVLQGHGIKCHTYTIAKRTGNIDAPRCPYMEPELLVIWIDGYRMGLNASAPTRAEE
ncbi:MAG: hypothetical protein NC127_09350 [Muribaculum sp.]|nr:hypothetical protein [Muribaculum sp.]